MAEVHVPTVHVEGPVAFHDHRFPVYGDHNCRKCGVAPDGLVAGVLALYDEEPRP